MSEKDVLLTAEELDTIGEIMNISMGSAATAVSTMLEKQVMITTPNLSQDLFGNIDCSNLEPALIVKIKYIEGIEGVNMIMLRRRDIQIILNLLMGNEFSDESEDFEFDDMSMSAACEVMNQMMGSSATALSEILGIPINISTPEATLVETKSEIKKAFTNIDTAQQVVEISFKMMIKDIVDTNFSCFLPTGLASKIVSMVAGEQVPEDEEPPLREEAPAAAAVGTVPAATVQAAPPAPPAAAAFIPAPLEEAPPIIQAAPPLPSFVPEPPATVAAQQPVMPSQPAVPAQPAAPVQPAMQAQTGAPVQTPQQYGYGMPGQVPYMPSPYGYMPPQGYAPQGYQAQPHQPQAYNVQNAEFPDFSRQMYSPVTPVPSMGLLMGVHLDVSVVIGRAKRKIKDIMEFGQGTVLELDKQTGAPAEIMVNGQLLAYGDVIVVGDNFGIRITEIVGTKELLDSLESK